MLLTLIIFSKMNKYFSKACFLGGILLMISGHSINAQEQSLGAMVNKKVDMYVFPAGNQSDEQMTKDENDCYQWAVKQSGVDPLNPTQVQAAQVDTGPDGSAVRGAARGALAGVAIGAIAGDAGMGAAIGATAGGLGGHRAGRMEKSQQQQANNQAAAQTEVNMTNSFKKAYSVCLEGKGYTVQ